jgi:hypothetical protein
MKPFPTHDSQDFWNASPFNSYVERRGEKVKARRTARMARKAAKLQARGGTKPTGIADRTLSAQERTAAAKALPGHAEGGWLVFYISRDTGRLEAQWTERFWGAFTTSAKVPGRVTRTLQVASVLTDLLDHQADLASGLE